MKLDFQTRQKIVAQALQEIVFARDWKQGKVRNWKLNEDLYYGRKAKSIDARANVDLGLMGSFVHTILSKIDNPIVFKFTKKKMAQLRRVAGLNALKVSDQQTDNWDIKDIVGKKQCVIYGRTIYFYHAESYAGYCAHLENCDVYDFLIDPAAGGIDVELANYLGRYGIRKNKSELKDGLKAGLYLKTETNNLITGNGNSTEINQEETNKQNRSNDQNTWNSQKHIENSDNYVFWEWFTTYKGQRYYLLLNDKGATAIRLLPLEEVFESGLWPVWTYAAFPDLTEFWTPSFCDYVREVFMSQATSINQMLDNAEQINKPQKAIDVGAIRNLAELKYRREGIIRMKAGTDINKAIQTIAPAPLQSPIIVYDKLDAIQEKASGVTAADKGVASEDRVAIYQGNQAASADRFGFLNKSYSFGYKRFAKLYEAGVREHLVKKVAVDILGPEGLEIIEISKRDIFRKGETFNVLVESSNAEMALSAQEQTTKIAFLDNQSKLPNTPQNPQKAYEIEAGIAGFDEETVRELLDKSDFAEAKVMAEAERDIERLLDGEKFAPNPIADTSYMQRFVDYMKDHEEDITEQQFVSLKMYVELLQPIIMNNMIQRGNELAMKAAIAAPGGPGVGPDGQPLPAPAGPMGAPAPAPLPLTR